jgi:hypothetical protein
LLEKELRVSQPDDEVQTVARTRTLTVLRGLDGVRKGAVVQFLFEAGLISVAKPQGESKKPSEPIVSLNGAVLSKVNLIKANLSGAYLPDGTPWTEETDMGRFTNQPSDTSE